MIKAAEKIVALMMVATLITGNVHALGKTNYVLDTDGQTRIPTPLTHQVKTAYGYFGAEGQFLNNPADLFIDKKDNVYIADAENNRVVKLDSHGNYIRSFTNAGKLKGPQGVYVDENEELYIADTQNSKIVHVSKDDQFIEEFVKPKSNMISDDTDFKIGRMGLSKQGYIYMIQGQNFMTIDANNEFKGYVGTNDLGFSIVRTLIRIFASDAQKRKILKETPPAYNSFDIGEDGMVYAVTVESKQQGQIQKINAVGENIYPVRKYGETYYNEHTKSFNNARFVDIAVNEEGIIYALEAYSQQIYVYDQEGVLLTVFGGEGDIKGLFKVATAIDVNSKGDVYVLDGSTGKIHHFMPTKFMSNILKSVAAYTTGQYEQSYDMWNQVLQIDANYPVANCGIAKTLFKAGDVDKAMEYYKLADDKSGYGTAFEEYRYKVFRQNFGLIVLIMVILFALIIVVLSFLKKKSDRLVTDYFKIKR